MADERPTPVTTGTKGPAPRWRIAPARGFGIRRRWAENARSIAADNEGVHNESQELVEDRPDSRDHRVRVCSWSSPSAADSCSGAPASRTTWCTTSLSEQKITVPAEGQRRARPEGVPRLQRYAGQTVDNGPKAKAYADQFIKVHLKGIAQRSDLLAGERRSRQANPKDAALAGRDADPLPRRDASRAAALRVGLVGRRRDRLLGRHRGGARSDRGPARPRAGLLRPRAPAEARGRTSATIDHDEPTPRAGQPVCRLPPFTTPTRRIFEGESQCRCSHGAIATPSGPPASRLASSPSCSASSPSSSPPTPTTEEVGAPAGAVQVTLTRVRDHPGEHLGSAERHSSS